jgi:hypothetical protein
MPTTKQLKFTSDVGTGQLAGSVATVRNHDSNPQPSTIPLTNTMKIGYFHSFPPGSGSLCGLCCFPGAKASKKRDGAPLAYMIIIAGSNFSTQLLQIPTIICCGTSSTAVITCQEG